MPGLEFNFNSPYGNSGLFYPDNPEFPTDPGGNPDPPGGGTIHGGITDPGGQSSGNNPYTGDAFSLGFYVLIMATAMVSLLLIQVKVRKKKRQAAENYRF